MRSDTVTLPTEEMLEAIRHAELGDDIRDGDPTVKRLEEMAADMMDKESAMLVPSGTMANLVSIVTQTSKGDQVVLEAESYIYYYGNGGLCIVGGVLPWPLKGHLGVLNPRDVENALRPKSLHHTDTTLICIENSHQRAGGTVWSPDQVKAVSVIAKAHSIPLYMDASRIFNAAVALQVDCREFTRHVDSLMFCLSKGLSCPMGSVLVGDHDFIDNAKRVRQMLGGGMRQAGIVAAPGIIALENMIDRLKYDHENAAVLAKGLAKLDGISINLKTVQTNIVKFDVSDLGVDSDKFISRLKEKGVLAIKLGKTIVRMVTHRGIEREDIEYSLRIIEDLVRRIT